MPYQEEGLYDIKRVEKLPKRGNSNYLYDVKGTKELTNFYRWLSSGTYEAIPIGFIKKIVGGKNIIVDDTDPQNPIVDLVLPKLIKANVSGTYTLDYSDGNETWSLTMLANTALFELEESLPALSNTKVITIYLQGNFTPTFPAAWDTILGEYDGSKPKNQIVVEYIEADTYWVNITPAP